MTARDFLVRGLLVGLLAGFAAFFVAYTVGEPHVEAAIALEEAGTADEAATDGHTHSHGDEGAIVSRDSQRTWGLLTGTVGIGVALGGLVALASATAMGRLGRMLPGQSTAVVALVGFVSVSLVPFLKYPATPPAVGDGETIGSRTALYFAFVLVSVVGAIVATVVASRVWHRSGAYAAVLAGTGLYLLVAIAAGVLMPSVSEVGGFPADVLWSFRISSLFTLVTLWAVIGVLLTGFVSRLHARHQAAVARRELAASL